MAFVPTEIKMQVDVQIVTYHPDNLKDKHGMIALRIEQILRDEAVKQDFLVGMVRVSTLHEKTK